LPPYQTSRRPDDTQSTFTATPSKKLIKTILNIPGIQNIDKSKTELILFNLAIDDWLLIISYLERYLGMIESELFGDTKVGQMIRWKKSLGISRYFLPRLEELSGRMASTDDVTALDLDIEYLQRRIEKIISHIMSSVTMQESQRAIKETESVTQLTEMAFIFIPLSYVAAVFGMGIPVTFSFTSCILKVFAK